MNMRPPQEGDNAAPGDWNWSTGMVVWTPKDGHRLGRDDKAAEGGWGRRSGSCGWFGAAGTMYFIDPQSNLTVSISVCRNDSAHVYPSVCLYNSNAARESCVDSGHAEGLGEARVRGITRIIAECR
jgi:CubicO group peptidase (beta-lactamase class C family)